MQKMFTPDTCIQQDNFVMLSETQTFFSMTLLGGLRHVVLLSENLGTVLEVWK